MIIKIKKTITLLTIFCILFIFALSCSGQNTDELKITDVSTTTKVDEQTYEALKPTNEFEVTEPEIHVVATISGSTPQKTEITTEWYYLDEYTFIDSETINAAAKTGPVWFSLTKPDNDWLVGDYQIKFLIDGDEVFAKTFKVIEDPTSLKISNVNISSSIDPNTYEAIDIADVFDSSSQEIFVTGLISNAVVGQTEIMSEWYHVDEEMFIDSAFITVDKQEGVFWFSLEKDQEYGWIPGKYQVAIFVDDKQMDLRYFEVSEDPNAPSLSGLTTASMVDEDTFEVTMATDTFSTLTPEIHVLANYDKCVPNKTEIYADWDYLDEGIYVNTTKIVANDTNGVVWFSLLKPETNWPEGKYKISFYMDGMSSGEVFFEVLDGGFSTSLSNITTAKSVNSTTYIANDKTSVFKPDSPEIHVVADVNYAVPDQTQIKTEWYYLDENIFIAENTVTALNEMDTVWFTLTKPDTGWPIGSYKIKFFVDGVEANDILFDVR